MCVNFMCVPMHRSSPYVHVDLCMHMHPLRMYLPALTAYFNACTYLLWYLTLRILNVCLTSEQ